MKDNAYTRCLTEHAWACKPYICGGWDSDDCCEYQSCCECMCLTSLKAVYTPIFPIVLLSQGTVFLISSPFIIKKHPARYEQRIEKADVAVVIDDLLGDAKWMKKCLEEVNEQEKPALIVAAVAVEEAQGLEEVVVEAPANEEIEREM